jgi:ERCC4-type nuclease
MAVASVEHGLMEGAVVHADIFESQIGIPERLRALGADVEVRPLAAGDYRIGARLVERKTVLDLHGAIIKGRFWRQVGRLRRVSPHAYLLVEGVDLDQGPLRPNSVRGALLALAELGVHVLRTTDENDSASWLILLARRARGDADRPVYAQRPKRSRDASEAMLAAVPGLSVHSARALLNRFGSVGDVLAAGRENWLSTPGIGPKRAAALAQTLAHGRRRN